MLRAWFRHSFFNGRVSDFEKKQLISGVLCIYKEDHNFPTRRFHCKSKGLHLKCSKITARVLYTKFK